MKLGIVGLPNVGKSTLFNSITKAGAASANYPFCTIDPNIGVVTVPDERLKRIQEIYGSEKIFPAAIEFVDIAGLVEGAAQGEGLGNQFLSHIREVDAIVHLVRCFEDDNISHVESTVDPQRDIHIINLELILADLDVVNRRLERETRMAKNSKEAMVHVKIIETIKNHLEEEKPVRDLDKDIYSREEHKFIEEMNLLTDKPVLYAANCSETDLADDGASNPHVATVRTIASNEGNEAFIISAAIEAELSELDEKDKLAYLEELGANKSGLDLIISASYKLLGLISYMTAGPKETRAWTITKGTKAPQAAGKIHSDFERGFIRAEVIHFDDIDRLGSIAAAKEQGLLRSEGKDYVMKDGDIALFRFNV